MPDAGTVICVLHIRSCAWLSESREHRRSFLTWGFLLSCIFRYNRYRYDQHHRHHDQPHRNHHNDAPHTSATSFEEGRTPQRTATLHNGGKYDGLQGLAQLRRNPIPRTGVKIVSAVALFHSFGVARQGPWITWVNKG